jgi:hypothetical protein
LLEHGTGGPAPLASTALASIAEPSVSPLVVVPEPAAWVLGAWIMLAIGIAYQSRRRASRAAN